MSAFFSSPLLLFLPTALPRAGGENQLHSTICQLPLETFNSNKIYGLSFQRILPVKFISRKVVVKATIVSRVVIYDSNSRRGFRTYMLRTSMNIMYASTYGSIYLSLQSILCRPRGIEIDEIHCSVCRTSNDRTRQLSGIH